MQIASHYYVISNFYHSFSINLVLCICWSIELERGGVNVCFFTSHGSYVNFRILSVDLCLFTRYRYWNTLNDFCQLSSLAEGKTRIYYYIYLWGELRCFIFVRKRMFLTKFLKNIKSLYLNAWRHTKVQSFYSRHGYLLVSWNYLLRKPEKMEMKR